MNRGKGRAIQRRTSRAIESHLQTVGWISRQKISRVPAEGEAFLLTSLFIEPPIRKRPSFRLPRLPGLDQMSCYSRCDSEACVLERRLSLTSDRSSPRTRKLNKIR